MSKRVPVTQQFASNQKVSRRTILKMGLGISIVPITGASCSNSSQPTKQTWTPRQAEGPFYPVHEQEDKDADLTLIQGNNEPASGEIIHVRGRVLDMNGDAIKNAFIEIWQANAKGRYRHYKDPNKAAIDPNFQGWGMVKTDAEGRYSFTTIKPGAYGVDEKWTRPPHIHYKVSRRGYQEITTQMYFAGEELNDSDALLQNVAEESRDSLVVDFHEVDGLPSGHFPIVLAKAV